MDVDLNQLFKEKNKEIIKNNLIIDIERNVIVLKDTISNIVNNNFDICIKNIDTIFSDSYCDNYYDFINKETMLLKDKLLGILHDGINKKEEKLTDLIKNIEFTDKDMEDYYKYVNTSSNDINNILYDNLLKNTISSFDKYIDKNVKDEYKNLAKTRISDYLINRLFGKIQDQIKDQLNFRDISLSNKGKESYLKYQDICKKTINE